MSFRLIDAVISDEADGLAIRENFRKPEGGAAAVKPAEEPNSRFVGDGRRRNFADFAGFRRLGDAMFPEFVKFRTWNAEVSQGEEEEAPRTCPASKKPSLISLCFATRSIRNYLLRSLSGLGAETRASFAIFN